MYCHLAEQNRFNSKLKRWGLLKRNRLQRELSDEKEKTKKLESDIRLIVRERNSEVEELKQIISSLENN